jgi:hypothetical protein
MVGRLIEQQHVRLIHKRLCQGRTAQLPAREVAHGCFGVKAKGRDDDIRPVGEFFAAIRFGEAMHHKFTHRLVWLKIDLLRKVANACTGQQEAFARIGLEFMNALFSSAIGKGYLFACIVKISGEIVFYNRPFQAIFPGYTAQDTRTLKALLDLYNVPEGDRDSLRKFMTENSGGSIATTINAKAQTEKTSITFHLEPIERPTGFFLLRGK